MITPCIQICKLDNEGFCVGCHRSKEEIKFWTRYSDDERLEVMYALEERKVHRTS